MKLINARQAWHDAFYVRGSSVSAGAVEMARLGRRVQKSEVNNSTQRAADQFVAGLVQSAIGSLSPSLRGLGNWLYSPTATVVDMGIAHALVWFAVLPKLGELRANKYEKCYWLAMAALRSYQAEALGRQPWGAARVCEWLGEYYEVKLAEQNWSRDWAVSWNLMRETIAVLDAEALAPVAVVVDENRDFLRENRGFAA